MSNMPDFLAKFCNCCNKYQFDSHSNSTSLSDEHAVMVFLRIRLWCLRFSDGIERQMKIEAIKNNAEA